MRRLLLIVLLAPAAPAAAQRLDYRPVSDESLAAGPRLAYRTVEGDSGPAGFKLQWGLLDRFEYAAQRGRDGYAWDFSMLLGGDRHRLWLGTSGEGAAWARPDYSEFNAFYSRNLGGGWDANAGLRYDAQSGPDRAYAVLGGQYDDGEALWAGAWAYLSAEGEVSARLAAYYNLKLAGSLFVQPSAEIDYYGEDMPELGLGRGFGYAEAGLRLRYEIREAFSPYLGVSWSRDLGRTARLTREEGEDPETKSLVLGVRSAF
ncbi:MAG TPA: copper resistance protein B [Allosphingosinicella sp.]|jgi:copper resistance protein B